jgi:membrane associated rhomboid family serine protease
VIPLKDENPTRRRAYVTLALIAINVGVYFWVQPDTSDLEKSTLFTLEYAAVPCEVTTNEPLSDAEINATFGAGDTDACNVAPEPDGPYFAHKHIWLSILVSMFLHGSLLHLGGNMLFLWIFGNNIEDRLGRVKYLAFYVVGGIVATFAHILVQPKSTVPMIGASGAIAGVMGAYLAWFPNVRIRTLIIFYFILFRDIPAKWLLGFWFVSQFFELVNPNSGIAWMAHVGGFAYGFVAGLVMRSVRGTSRPVAPGHY